MKNEIGKLTTIPVEGQMLQRICNPLENDHQRIANPLEQVCWSTGP
ncbi:MAG TPA: hypothetical protein VIK10_07650 [Prolixibacteraceae bacterium]